MPKGAPRSSRLAVWDLIGGSEAFGVDGVARGKGYLLWTPNGRMVSAAMGDGSVAAGLGRHGATLITASGDRQAIFWTVDSSQGRPGNSG